MTPEALWHEYSKSSELDNKNESYRSWYFSNNEKDANGLLDLVIKGRKRATSSAFDVYPHIDENLPEVGDLSVITDWAGNAHCIIETINIEIIPFDKVSEDFAKLEGEGDLSLRHWRSVHQEFFTNSLFEFGIAFNGKSKVVCETFKLIFTNGS